MLGLLKNKIKLELLEFGVHSHRRGEGEDQDEVCTCTDTRLQSR